MLALHRLSHRSRRSRHRHHCCGRSKNQRQEMQIARFDLEMANYAIRSSGVLLIFFFLFFFLLYFIIIIIDESITNSHFV